MTLPANAFFNDDWKRWIWSNVGNGVPKTEIFRILLENGFPREAVQLELGFTPNPAAEPLPARAAVATAVGTTVGVPQDHLPGTGNNADWQLVAPLLWSADEVLSAEECALLIERARPRLVPCTVVTDPERPGTAGEGASEIRTSSSGDLAEGEPMPEELRALLDRLRMKICELSGLPIENQESFQILHYAEGEHYAPHHDAFSPGSEYLRNEASRGGQRLFTFVAYLNDVERGGETDFPNQQVKVEPKSGRGACWLNAIDGELLEENLHAALPVEQGEKWLFVCWVREARFSPQYAVALETQASERQGADWGAWLAAEPRDISQPDWIAEQTREQRSQVPFFNAGGKKVRGFEKRPLPDDIYAEILAKYQSLRGRFVAEADPAIGSFVDTVNPHLPAALYAEDHAFNQHVLELLQPMHEEWCGFELQPAACYGFRAYLHGAYLHDHVDRRDTHVVSSTLCVDSELYSPWNLHAVDIDGKGYEVDMRPGDHVLYESAQIVHGRPTPLNGKYHVGMFVHFKPAWKWELWVESPKRWWKKQRGRK